MTVQYLVSDLVEETRRHLLGTSRSEMNRISGPLTNSATTFIVDFDLAGISRGSYVGIENEIVLVWATDGKNTVTACQRGMLGTTAVNHTPPITGLLIEVNPRFARYDVSYALREEIRSWGPQVFRVKRATVQTTNDIRGYDLASLGSFYGILDVQRSAVLQTGMTDPKSWPRVGFKLIRKADPTAFPSGNGLVIDDVYPTSPAPALNVVYSAPFDVDTAWADSTDLLADVGLDPSQLDIAPLGAAWRLMTTRDIRRSMTESAGQSADLTTVPLGGASAVAKQLKMARDSRLADEQLSLRAKYPIVNMGT